VFGFKSERRYSTFYFEFHFSLPVQQNTNPTSITMANKGKDIDNHRHKHTGVSRSVAAPTLPEIQPGDLEHSTITDPDLIRFWSFRCEAQRNIEITKGRLGTIGSRANNELKRSLLHILSLEESRLRAFDKSFWKRFIKLYPELKDNMKSVKVRRGYALITRPERCPTHNCWLKALWKRVSEAFCGPTVKTQ